ncbi:FkbM family methyltransferase [Mucilaginibacter celer]|uniref:FkbM family methyltransferase n=1 Tax=Mucilaginibacter celer TaxID=2305508 RepID=A0A494VS29_9SPHI|nr:FkbM family methyltransferase [Mucilaginibacter celer]AYL97259.1 FkbM family methyltransferase [Mucilaginibacter celer]
MQAVKRTIGFILNHPLAKKHRLRAFWRFACWQLQSRLSGSRFIIKPFIGNVKFYAAKGLTGITGNIYTGLHEFTDMAFLLHFLRPEDLFFDIGANVGSYTLLASGHAGASSITLEPVSSTFQILSKNIVLNDLHNQVTLINAGAGAETGEIRFSADQDTRNHVIAANETNKTDTITVRVITVDSLSTAAPPALIKIDVEGFETEVLKGMADTLMAPELKAIIIELNGSGKHYGFNEANIHELLLSHSFKPFTYNPFKRALTQLKTFGSYNTIYCRDIDFVNNRLQHAAAIKIMGQTI